MLHPRSRNSTNRLRLADCGRRPGPFFTRRDEDNTTPRISEALRPSIETTLPREGQFSPAVDTPEKLIHERRPCLMTGLNWWR
jgi:hypothetical protein